MSIFKQTLLAARDAVRCFWRSRRRSGRWFKSKKKGWLLDNGQTRYLQLAALRCWQGRLSIQYRQRP